MLRSWLRLLLRFPALIEMTLRLRALRRGRFLLGLRSADLVEGFCSAHFQRLRGCDRNLLREFGKLFALVG